MKEYVKTWSKLWWCFGGARTAAEEDPDLMCRLSDDTPSKVVELSTEDPERNKR